MRLGFYSARVGQSLGEVPRYQKKKSVIFKLPQNLVLAFLEQKSQKCFSNFLLDLFFHCTTFYVLKAFFKLIDAISKRLLGDLCKRKFFYEDR
jgi:hypothetical protein